MAADALRVCPMASGFGFADHVIIIIIITDASSLHATVVKSMTLSIS